MEKLYCAYCGELLSDGCDCEYEAETEKQSWIEELEQHQHDSGFYAFQDKMESYRMER